MSRPIALSRLKSASPGKRDELLSGLVAGARQPVNGYAGKLNDRIAEYERRYEMPSDEMLERVGNGTLPETDDIASWLMALKVRNRVGGH